jgi:hypothetical protein
MMGLYEKAPSGIGQFPTPPGVTLPVGFPGLELFGQLIEQLGLEKLGLYTPWGARESGVEWEEVDQPPDTNIAAFVINDAVLKTAMGITFGNPIPFIAVITDGLPTPATVEAAFAATPYQFYQTQAVYRQEDKSLVPRLYFMHWAEYRKPGDPLHGKGSIDTAAAKISGTCVYATQVDYTSTAQRSPPPVPFQQALTAQIGGGALPPPPLPGDLPAPPPPGAPAPTEAAPKKSYVLPVILGIGLAAGTFAAVRAIRKKKG